MATPAFMNNDLDFSFRITLAPDDAELFDLSPFDDLEDDFDQSPTTPSTMLPQDVPVHPIPSMQGPFAESMREVNGASPTVPIPIVVDAEERRRILIDQDIADVTHAARWHMKPGQRHHELWKLMAQISFGIYLLLGGIAKDETRVSAILQGHINRVDEFLQSTLEDFALAQKDIESRLSFLKIPLQNIEMFDAMLENRHHRNQIVNGNERIGHIISRTAAAMKDALEDVAQGLDACKEFAIYLAELQEQTLWRERRPDMVAVFDAMKGNAEGWYKAYISLQTKGNELGVGLIQLGSIIAEMDRRAGDISRKNRVSSIYFTSYFISQSSMILLSDIHLHVYRSRGLGGVLS